MKVRNGGRKQKLGMLLPSRARRTKKRNGDGIKSEDMRNTSLLEAGPRRLRGGDNVGGGKSESGHAT